LRREDKEQREDRGSDPAGVAWGGGLGCHSDVGE
jgi:hypothetical protein